MNIANGIRSYVNSDETKIIIIKNKIDIINYKDIGHFDLNKIIVKLKTNDICINGKNLVISKLMDDEILITGEIINIEFR